MYFSKAIPVVVLALAASAVAAPAATEFGVATPAEALEAREAKPDLEARGFGCGVFSSRYECNDHCKSLGGGRTGGYCGGFLYHTCKCVFG